MATLRLHPPIYRPTSNPIGHSYKKGVRLSRFYWLLFASVNEAAPLKAAAFSPQLWSTVWKCRPSEKHAAQRGSSGCYNATQTQHLVGLSRKSYTKNECRNTPVFLSGYITSTWEMQLRWLVQTTRPRACGAKDANPIGPRPGHACSARTKGHAPRALILNQNIRIYVPSQRHTVAIFETL